MAPHAASERLGLARGGFQTHSLVNECTCFAYSGMVGCSGAHSWVGIRIIDGRMILRLHLDFHQVELARMN